jgi:hypothetical protein
MSQFQCFLIAYSISNVISMHMELGMHGEAKRRQNRQGQDATKSSSRPWHSLVKYWTADVSASGAMRRESAARHVISSHHREHADRKACRRLNITTHREFQLNSSVGRHNLQIPKHLFLTGPFHTYDAFLRQRKVANLTNPLGITPDLQVHYFNNAACREYLQKFYDDELLTYFEQEDHGSYRGDICRTAILAREGGFYVDLDFQLRVPLTSLVDDSTSFMTARSSVSGCLNALIATVPRNPIMLATLTHIRKWYRNETTHNTLLGPMTLQRGLEDFITMACPVRNWTQEDEQFECGTQKGIRLYTEALIRWGSCQVWGTVMCPPARSQSKLWANKYGLFAGRPKDIQQPSGCPTSAQIAFREERFIGWPRGSECKVLGCALSGGLPATDGQ